MGRGTKILLWVIGAPVVVLCVMAYMGSHLSPEEEQRQRDAEAIDLCDQEAGKQFDAGARRIATGACGLLRDRYREKYGHDY